MKFNITIQPLNSDNVTRFNACSLQFLQEWISTKANSFEKNLQDGTTPVGKHNNRKQLKKQIK